MGLRYNQFYISDSELEIIFHLINTDIHNIQD